MLTDQAASTRETNVTEWADRPCRGANTELFYYEDEDTIAELREDFCARCPLRRQCFEAAMEREAGTADDSRFGFCAGLTSGQRLALDRRGIWRCPECSAVFDPLGFATGELFCDCGASWNVRPLPEDGASWFDRQTVLGEKVVAWLIQQTEPGEQVPLPTALARTLGARKADMTHVFEALVLDGTLQRYEGPRRYVRVGQTVALRRWQRFHLAARDMAA